MITLLFLSVYAHATLNSYSSKLDSAWKHEVSVSNMDIWKLDEHTRLSVAEIDPKRSSLAKYIDAKPNLDKIEDARKEEMKRAGMRDWRPTHTDQKANELKVEGTYVAPSGAKYCFAERHVRLKRKILQIILTAKAGCDLIKLSQTVDAISVHQ